MVKAGSKPGHGNKQAARKASRASITWLPAHVGLSRAPGERHKFFLNRLRWAQSVARAVRSNDEQKKHPASRTPTAPFNAAPSNTGVLGVAFIDRRAWGTADVGPQPPR